MPLADDGVATGEGVDSAMTLDAALDLDDAGIPRVPGEPASAPMPPEWRKKILEMTADGNRWLEETYDLPVARYGYFG